MKPWRRRKSDEAEERGGESPSERQTRKQERKGQKGRRGRRPFSSSHGVRSTGPFFSSLFIPALPVSPTTISLPLFLLRFSSFSSTHGGCTRVRTYVRTYIRVLRLLRSLLVRTLSSLVLLAFSPLVHLHLLRRRALVRVPVHSFVESPLAFSGHVAHAARKRGGEATRHDTTRAHGYGGGDGGAGDAGEGGK